MQDRPMKRLFQYLGRYRSSLSFAISSSVINKIFDLMPPFLTAWLIDSVSGQIPAWIGEGLGMTDVWRIIALIGVLIIVIFAGESLFEWFFKREFLQLAQRVQHDLRLDAYGHMQDRELAYFEDQRTGNLMSMLNDDINQLERFLNANLNDILQLTVLVIFAGWSLCAANLTLGILGLLPIPFIVVGSIYYQKKIAPYYKQVREGVGILGNRLENNISGISVIKSFTAEQYELERVGEASQNYRDANFRAIRWSSVYVPLIRMFIALGFAGTLVLGAYWVIEGKNGFTLGGLAFFAMMIQRLLWPVTRLGTISDEYERARASARRIFNLLDSKNAISSFEKPIALSHLSGDIQFEAVNFEYKAGLPILKHINLDIQAGETIGVAGPTGGGKSTLVKLLLRFYDVSSGTIRLDNHPIKQLSLTQIRSNIALVSQEVYLFHGSIKENIAYGKLNSTDAEIVQAAKQAQLHDFILSLPNEYETIVGERGIKLSGGQRQRLSIARAVLKNAPILILDEATSAVDTETERAIQASLDELTKNRTAIIIAHRLSTIRRADKIIVLKDGSIVEQGSHDNLLLQNGIYADLWQVQVGVLA
ncbi:MAG: ABC transporter ATP-binding protein [Bacteroidota bacterium]